LIEEGLIEESESWMHNLLKSPVQEKYRNKNEILHVVLCTHEIKTRFAR
jgi:hypothetical protein